MKIETLLCDSIKVMGTLQDKKGNVVLDVSLDIISEDDLLETVCNIIGTDKFKEITEDIIERLDDTTLMQYNICTCCGARDGRAGMLFNSLHSGYEGLCMNCKDTFVNQEFTLHTNLYRTGAEIERMYSLLANNYKEAWRDVAESAMNNNDKN